MKNKSKNELKDFVLGMTLTWQRLWADNVFDATTFVTLRSDIALLKWATRRQVKNVVRSKTLSCGSWPFVDSDTEVCSTPYLGSQS